MVITIFLIVMVCVAAFYLAAALAEAHEREKNNARTFLTKAAMTASGEEEKNLYLYLAGAVNKSAFLDESQRNFVRAKAEQWLMIHTADASVEPGDRVLGPIVLAGYINSCGN